MNHVHGKSAALTRDHCSLQRDNVKECFCQGGPAQSLSVALLRVLCDADALLPSAMPRRPLKRTFARMDAHARGIVIGAAAAGMPQKDIAKLVQKTDKSRPTVRAVQSVLAKHREDPTWRGQEAEGRGAKPKLTAKEKKRLESLVFKERASAKVTIPFCRKRLPFLKRVSEECVRVALHESGLAWLVRRTKRRVPKPDKKARKAYCAWVLKQKQGKLDNFAYTDGTSFYLARFKAEKEDKGVLGLGKYAWRMSNGKDGLWEENVGPSCYAKSQGLPVKIWGFFGRGRLEYHVLPKDGSTKTKHMNGARYNHLVKTKFAGWRRSCFGRKKPVFLVKDHEKCLWQHRNNDAEQAAGLHLVENFPKSSPDLNAIEGWWRRLKDLLIKTEPSQLERRSDFLRRLRRAVNRLNRTARDEGRSLCANQKVRAREILSPELNGARSRW